MTLVFLTTVLLLAFANGANDNFKGVATLWGGGQLSYKQAWWLANIATLLGAVVAVVLGAEVAKTFSGKDVVPLDILQMPAFALSFSGAAFGTVALATWWSFPVSTTHAILGALAGCGLAFARPYVDFMPLVKSGAIPLLVSPLLAALLTAFMIRLSGSRCVSALAGRLPSSSHVAHVCSAASVCFARAVNDTPKIASIALLGTFAQQSTILTYVGIGVVMTFGGALFCHRVAHVLSQKITTMDAEEGLVANLVTALLVIFASKFGLAVSTTHVSVGALFGIGLTNKRADRGKIAAVLLSWVLTLPVSFVFGYGLSWVLS